MPATNDVGGKSSSLIENYPISVADAAKRLDSVTYFEWSNRVDVNKLDLSDETNCVLGQVYGSYEKGFKELFGVECTVEYTKDDIYGQQACHQEWVKEILQRRQEIQLILDESLASDVLSAVEEKYPNCYAEFKYKLARFLLHV